MFTYVLIVDMPYDFERALVVFNEHATNAGTNRMQTMITDPLQRRGIPFEIVKTSRPTDANPNINSELLGNALCDGDLVVVCGGDGTINQAATAIIDAKKSTSTALAVAPCGRGNDIAYGLNGKGFDFEAVVKGQAICRQIGVMAISATGNQEPLKKYAVGCLGIGLTGTLGKQINQPAYRLQRETSPSMALTDIIGLLPICLRAPKFQYEQASEVKQAIELLFINNKRMALYFRFKKSPYDNNGISHIAIESIPDLIKQLTLQKVGAYV
jgi:diacylglycerol kinase family enzyme